MRRQAIIWTNDDSNIQSNLFMMTVISVHSKIPIKTLHGPPMRGRYAVYALASVGGHNFIFRKVSNIRRTHLGNKIVDHSDVAGASPIGAAPTTSSFSTQYLAPMDWAKTTARGNKKHLKLGNWCHLVQSNPVISRAVNSRKSVSRACTLDPKF